MKNKLLGYAYEVGAYEVNIYKVLEINGEIVFKLLSWRNFNRKEKIDEYVKALEDQVYKSKEYYINKYSSKKLIKSKIENPVSMNSERPLKK